jgi:hypothetical protein
MYDIQAKKVNTLIWPDAVRSSSRMWSLLGYLLHLPGNILQALQVRRASRMHSHRQLCDDYPQVL